MAESVVKKEQQQVATLDFSMVEADSGLGNKEVDQEDIETLGKETLKEYGEHAPDVVLEKRAQISPPEIHAAVEELTISKGGGAESILSIAREKGIRKFCF